jgi:hypothetical protein
MTRRAFVPGAEKRARFFLLPGEISDLSRGALAVRPATRCPQRLKTNIPVTVLVFNREDESNIF